MPPAATKVRSCFSEIRHRPAIALNLSTHRTTKVTMFIPTRYRAIISVG